MRHQGLEALDYHSGGRPGKVGISVTKPCGTQHELSLAYTPGVAAPCVEISRDPEQAYAYTAKGNLVAVVTNGSSVLGLGHLGPLASKPVMEGKAVLFKRFADIDAFDIELDAEDVETMVRVVRALEPSFGGINLEDIRSPECFLVEEQLRRQMRIPVFHDDQHGTAIVTGAALLNALEVAGKRIDEVRAVTCGAGAAAIACARLHTALGLRPEGLTLCDSRGVVYRGRTEGMNPFKERLAADTGARTLEDALRGADIFFGLSVKGVLPPALLRSMARDPIVFALANPDPEIDPDAATEARPDAIVATGRSDSVNQVNNVLGFPGVFRGALDVRATAINEAMELAAVHALADLARRDVPEDVLEAYGVPHLAFGRDYIIPKALDPRVAVCVATAIAEAAVRSGAARRPLDAAAYRASLEKRLVPARECVD